MYSDLIYFTLQHDTKLHDMIYIASHCRHWVTAVTVICITMQYKSNDVIGMSIIICNTQYDTDAIHATNAVWHNTLKYDAIQCDMWYKVQYDNHTMIWYVIQCNRARRATFWHNTIWHDQLYKTLFITPWGYVNVYSTVSHKMEWIKTSI